MIKKIKIELFILIVLLINIFISSSIDFGFYNFLDNFSKPFQNTFLKDFFKQITILGDSKWYFLLSIFSILLFYFVKKNNYYINKKNIIEAYSNFAIFLFFSLIISGILTQLIKHIVGRPRPNHSLLDGSFEFNFFNLNSEFHSFPSGHSSTIFIVALVIALFLPKLKYFFILLALIVASSRIVVGAHFLTDVLGGITVAYLGFKLTKFFLDRYFSLSTNIKSNFIFNNKFYFSLIIFLSLAVFFVCWFINRYLFKQFILLWK